MEQREDWHLTDLVGHESGRADPFAAAVRATRMPMVITDPNQPDNPIVFANEAFQILTGYSRDEIIGRNCRFLQGRDTDRTQIARVKKAVAAGESIDVDLLNYRKDGSSFWNALYLSPVYNDAGVVTYFFASQLDVSNRIEAQESLAHQKELIEIEVKKRTAELEKAVEAKNVLLHEIDHRVKNNLTMIGSLLRLQARTISDPTILEKLNAMLERVDALATVHRRLYQSENLKTFDVGAFGETLLRDIIGVSGRSDIEVRIDNATIEVPASAATAIGLILNEIITNAIKHAYANGRSGTLRLDARREEGRGVVSISDDGPGFSQASSTGGLGRTLIERLAKQVGADVSWTASSPAGTCVTLVLPEKA